MDDNQIQEQWTYFKELLLSTKRPNIENLINWLETTDFKEAPASTMYHNSFRGGLLAHSINVYHAMHDFDVWLKFYELPEESVIIASLLHDLCKVYCYETYMKNVKNEFGQWVSVPSYKFEEAEPLGHGAKSVMMIYEQGVQLTKVERAMIVNHMGYTEHDDPRRVSKLFRICPQSFILCCADMEATIMLESYDGPQRFIKKVVGKNLTESMKIIESQNNIRIDGLEYRLAPQDAEVDNKQVIYVNNNGQQIKVFAPYGDGLPF